MTLVESKAILETTIGIVNVPWSGDETTLAVPGIEI